MSDRYQRLLEAWRRERGSPDVQPLPPEFFSEMSEYSSALREQTRMLDTSSVRGKIAEKEGEYAEQMIRELSRLRLRKIIEAELENTAIPASALTTEEKRLHSDLRRLLSSHGEGVRDVLMGRAPRVEVAPTPGRGEQGFRVVRFLQPLPAIMGVDMKTYGPFKPEEVASIPAENAENLIRRGIAKEVEMEK